MHRDLKIKFSPIYFRERGGGVVVGKGGGRAIQIQTHLSWHSAFDSCELFYSHVTDCIKRTSGTVIDAFIVSTFLALFPSVYNESFIKLVPLRKFNSPYEYAAENGFSLLFRITSIANSWRFLRSNEIIPIPFSFVSYEKQMIFPMEEEVVLFILFVLQRWFGDYWYDLIRDPPRAGLYGKFVRNEERFERMMDTYME